MSPRKRLMSVESTILSYPRPFSSKEVVDALQGCEGAILATLRPISGEKLQEEDDNPMKGSLGKSRYCKGT